MTIYLNCQYMIIIFHMLMNNHNITSCYIFTHMGCTDHHRHMPLESDIVKFDVKSHFTFVNPFTTRMRVTFYLITFVNMHQFM